MRNDFFKKIDWKEIDFSKMKTPKMNESNISKDIERKVFGVFSDLAISHNQTNKESFAF